MVLMQYLDLWIEGSATVWKTCTLHGRNISVLKWLLHVVMCMDACGRHVWIKCTKRSFTVQCNGFNAAEEAIVWGPAMHSSTLRCILCFSVASKSNPQDELQWYVPFHSLFCYASGYLCPMLEQDASAHKEVWKTIYCYFMAFVWKLSFVLSCFSYVYLSSREHTCGQ